MIIITVISKFINIKCYLLRMKSHYIVVLIHFKMFLLTICIYTHIQSYKNTDNCVNSCTLNTHV